MRGLAKGLAVVALGLTALLLLRILTLPPVTGSEPAWSPDGSELLFSSDRDGGRVSYRMPLPGGEVQRVTPPGESAHYPAWSPDGQPI